MTLRIAVQGLAIATILGTGLMFTVLLHGAMPSRAGIWFNAIIDCALAVCAFIYSRGKKD